MWVKERIWLEHIHWQTMRYLLISKLTKLYFRFCHLPKVRESVGRWRAANDEPKLFWIRLDNKVRHHTTSTCSITGSVIVFISICAIWTGLCYRQWKRAGGAGCWFSWPLKGDWWAFTVWPHTAHLSSPSVDSLRHWPWRSLPTTSQSGELTIGHYSIFAKTQDQ